MWISLWVCFCFMGRDGMVEADLAMVDVYSPVEASSSSILMESRSGVLHLPQWAVEGTSSRYWSDCFISQRQLEPWWMLDLKTETLVTNVRVTTMRGSGNLPGVRLNGLDGLSVVIANTSQSNGSDGSTCGRPWRYRERELATIVFNCRGGVVGRYVYVRLNVGTPQYLALCEVVLNRVKGENLLLNLSEQHALALTFPSGDRPASLIIDGVNSTQSLLCARTGSLMNYKPWFRIFLKHPYLVTKVAIMMSSNSSGLVEVRVGSGLTKISDYFRCMLTIQWHGWRIYTCREPWLSHFVVVSSLSVGRLELCEVQVFYDPILDIYSPVSIEASSQQHLTNPVWKALDRSERIKSGECYQSVRGSGAFWKLSLTDMTSIHMVSITIKPSSYRDMDGMTVFVGNNTDTGNGLNQRIQCGSAWKATRDQQVTFDCASPIVGQYVYLSAGNKDTALLALCEVKVYQPESLAKFVSRPTDIILNYSELGTLTCAAVGQPTPDIKWFGTDGLPMNASSVQINGSIAVSMVNIHGSSGGGSVRCLIETGINSSISAIATVQVASHIVVKPQTHPKLVIDDVSDITLFCEAVGYPHPVVSWIKPSGVFVSSLTVTGKQNTAMSALRVGGLQEAGTYTCIAFNSIGRDTAQATVFARPHLSAPPLGCQFVFDGSVAESLHCVAMGYPNPRLSWTKNGVAVYAVEYNVSGTNNAVASNLTLDAVSVSDSGTYTCTASNGIGKPAVAESIVLVDARLPFPIEPKKTIAHVGEDVKMSCLALGYSYSTIVMLSWWKGPNTLPRSTWTTRRICGGVYSTLTVKNVAATDGSRNYYCKAGNVSSPNRFESTPAMLLVHPSILETPRNGTLLPGKSLTLVCKASGYPIPKISWSRRLGNDEHILLPADSPEKDLHTNMVTSRLVFGSSTMREPGQYSCIAESRLPGGSFIVVKSESALVAVPARVTTSFKTMTVEWGQSVSVECKAEGYPVPTISWHFLNTSVAERNDSVGSTWRQSALQIASFDGWNDGGDYRCSASNIAGNHHSPVASLQFLRQIVARPRSHLVPYGGNLSLFCSLVSLGNGNASVTWYKNGRPLYLTVPSEATSRGMMWHLTYHLIISSISLSDTGNYSCHRPTDKPAVVNVGPLFVESPKNEIVHSGEDVELGCTVLAMSGSDVKWETEVTWRDSIQVVTTGSETMSLLVLHNVSTAAAGWYRCVVFVLDPGTREWKKFSSTTSHITVIQQDVNRGVPRNVSVHLLTGQSVLISWREPDDLPGPVATYKIKYGGRKWYRANYQHHFLETNKTLTVNGSVLETRIDDLLVSVRFAFSVATVADGEVRTGTWSRPVYLRTPDDVPLIPILPWDYSLSDGTSVPQLVALTQPSDINGPLGSVHLLIASLAPGEDVASIDVDVPSPSRYSDRISHWEVYVTAQFKYNAIPSLFTVGNGRTYGGYFNGPLVPNTRYAYALRAYSLSPGKKAVYSTSLPLEFTSGTGLSGSDGWLLPVVIVSAGCLSFFFIVVFAVSLIVWSRWKSEKVKLHHHTRAVAMDQEDGDVIMVGMNASHRVAPRHSNGVVEDMELRDLAEEDFDTRPRVLGGIDGFRRSVVENCIDDEDFDVLDVNDSELNDVSLTDDPGSAACSR